MTSAPKAPPIPVIASGESLRVAVLSNPGSGKNRKGLNAIKAILAKHPHVAHKEACNPIEVAQALDEIAITEPDILAINAGDGTHAASLTALFHNKPFAKQPLFALLQGGTTNMNAGDIGLKGKHTHALEKLLTWASNTHPGMNIVQRPTLRINRGANLPPLCGMYFGTGAIVKGMEYCHKKIIQRGFQGSFGPGLCTMRVLYALARNDSRFIAPVPISLEIQSDAPQAQLKITSQNYFMLMTSALERLFLGIRPYWGSKVGTFNFSSIHAGPKHPFRAIPPILWGHANRFVTPENGYFSYKINALNLTMDSLFAVDGELYEVDQQHGRVRVDNGGYVFYLVT